MKFAKIGLRLLIATALEVLYRKISLIADAIAERYAAMSEIAMCELGFNTKTLKWMKLFSKVHFLAIFFFKSDQLLLLFKLC